MKDPLDLRAPVIQFAIFTSKSTFGSIGLILITIDQELESNAKAFTFSNCSSLHTT